MTSATGERGSEPARRPVSALPSVQARLLAFGAILLAGLCGGLIGFSAVKVGCQGTRTTATTVAKDCSTPEGVGGVAGAVIAAGGVAVIAVLVLRAMGEWRSIKEKRQLEALVAAASAAITPRGRAPVAEPPVGLEGTEPPPPGAGRDEILPAPPAEAEDAAAEDAAAEDVAADRPPSDPPPDGSP